MSLSFESASENSQVEGLCSSTTFPYLSLPKGNRTPSPLEDGAEGVSCYLHLHYFYSSTVSLQHNVNT